MIIKYKATWVPSRFFLLTKEVNFFKIWLVGCVLSLGLVSHAHEPDPLLILEIEEGQLNFEDEQIKSEYIAALKRQRLRKLAAMPWQERFWIFIKSGIEHIIPKGLDHILFVLGLFFFSTKIKPLIWQVSAFTLAHTITLALAALSVVNVSSTIIEPLIALSIVWIAVENCLYKNGNKWRLLLIFCFGLLHGLGFAAVLREYGLPKESFITSLLGFNIGVEIGQLLIIAAAFILVWKFLKKKWYRKFIQIPISIGIALVGLFWFFERIL